MGDMTRYKWTVIGAGPAGIAAVGRLLDHGIAPEKIAWVDPEFTAGDLGDKWRAVHSNTAVSLFLDYLNASPSFRFHEAPPFKLTEVDPGETTLLDLVRAAGVDLGAATATGDDVSHHGDRSQLA
jgi:cation diffusion facilitator CzcD-associated flavoprotein CzcO